VATKRLKLYDLVESEVASGVVLIIVFALAFLLANINVTADLYSSLVYLPIKLGQGNFSYATTFIQLVNDGLMTLFFLFIGLELKYQLVCGEYQDRKTLILPTMAATGGIIAPAIFYLVFNMNQESAKGWAIPIATDTAFMLGILSLFGRLITQKIRAFILSFSLIDDALALIILAIFFSAKINLMALSGVFVIIGVLLMVNYFNIRTNSLYLGLGAILWLLMVESGIHGTLSGAVLAMTIPVMIDGKINTSFHALEQTLRPLVCFIILPIFVFLNSGIDLDHLTVDRLLSPIALGTITGLFFGKQIGLFGFSWLAVKLNWAHLPGRTSWSLLYAISILGGTGFTLSLFIGDLTFEAFAPNYEMRVGVIAGSLLSILWGVIVLNIIKPRRHHDDQHMN